MQTHNKQKQQLLQLQQPKKKQQQQHKPNKRRPFSECTTGIKNEPKPRSSSSISCAF